MICKPYLTSAVLIAEIRFMIFYMASLAYWQLSIECGHSAYNSKIIQHIHIIYKQQTYSDIMPIFTSFENFKPKFFVQSSCFLLYKFNTFLFHSLYIIMCLLLYKLKANDLFEMMIFKWQYPNHWLAGRV